MLLLEKPGKRVGRFHHSNAFCEAAAVIVRFGTQDDISVAVLPVRVENLKRICGDPSKRQLTRDSWARLATDFLSVYCYLRRSLASDLAF